MDRRLLLWGGGSGVLATLLYLVAGLIPQALGASPTQAVRSLTFLAAASWPIFAIINSYALYRWIAEEQQGTTNRVSFLLTVVAYALVSTMITVQLAVQFAVYDRQMAATPDMAATWEVALFATRAVDLGLDLVWDLFFAVSLILGALPIYRHSQLGKGWAILGAFLGLLLIGLNAATFPWPPNVSGLFDVGPLVGLFGLALSTYMVWVGWRRGNDRAATPFAARRSS